ncbi:unnamed protein product [Trichogramma brassicae]|uniref:Uncharacterized protein n=1 Tax=Trichogramma brassicae TaxID=86971 RepID=A0A6H5J3M9_9HYME|nr:unnamed protein product [Trichogramma brassicae]
MRPSSLVIFSSWLPVANSFREGTGASLAIKGASTILLVMTATGGGGITIAGDDGCEERSQDDIGVFSSGSLLLESACRSSSPADMAVKPVAAGCVRIGVGSIPTRRIFEVRFFAWRGRACARGGAGTTQKEDPGYVISLRSGKKTPITVRAGSDRITISRSPRRGLTKLAIDGAQHSHDEVRSENHTHKRAPDAGAKAQLERMMAPEARTTLTR